MGADGGIKIYDFKKIKQNWKKIQNNLYELFSNKYSGYNYKTSDTNYLFDEDIALEILSYDIGNNSCGGFCDWLRTLHRECDTPYALSDYIIISNGDNVNEETHNFSNCFSPAHYDTVETWT